MDKGVRKLRAGFWIWAFTAGILALIYDMTASGGGAPLFGLLPLVAGFATFTLLLKGRTW